MLILHSACFTPKSIQDSCLWQSIIYIYISYQSYINHIYVHILWPINLVHGTMPHQGLPWYFYNKRSSAMPNLTFVNLQTASPWYSVLMNMGLCTRHWLFLAYIRCGLFQPISLKLLQCCWCWWIQLLPRWQLDVLYTAQYSPEFFSVCTGDVFNGVLPAGGDVPEDAQ